MGMGPDPLHPQRPGCAGHWGREKQPDPAKGGMSQEPVGRAPEAQGHAGAAHAGEYEQSPRVQGGPEAPALQANTVEVLSAAPDHS